MKVEEEPGVQESRWSARETGIGKETDSPLSLEKKLKPADILLLA